MEPKSSSPLPQKPTPTLSHFSSVHSLIIHFSKILFLIFTIGLYCWGNPSEMLYEFLLSHGKHSCFMFRGSQSWILTQGLAVLRCFMVFSVFSQVLATHLWHLVCPLFCYSLCTLRNVLPVHFVAEGEIW